MSDILNKVANAVPSKFDNGIPGSTYLLDLSKKCILGRGNSSLKDSPDGIPWSFYGDLDSKDLNNIGFQFVEDFHDGTEYAQKEVDKVLSPITKGIEGVLQKSPMLKNVNLNTETIRDSAIFLYAICKTIQGDAGPVKLSKDIMSMDVSPYYVLPMRGSTPKLNPVGSKGTMSIHFAYGKCNLFCARQEVWEPLQALKNAIFPVVSKNKKYGTVNTSGNAAPAPYPVQITTALFCSVLDMVGEVTAKDGFVIGEGKNKTIFDLQETLKDISTNLERADSGVELEKWEANIVDVLASKLPGNEFSTILNTEGKVNNLRKALKDTFKIGNNSINITDVEIVKDLDANEVAEDYISKGNEKLAEEVLKNSKKISIQPKKFRVKNAVEGKGKIPVIRDISDSDSDSDSDNGKKPGPETIAKTLINFVPNLVGKTTMDLEQQLEPYSYDMYFGFPPLYDTNLKNLYTRAWRDVKKEKTINGKKQMVTETEIAAAIHMSHFLFKKVTISFDFDHLDTEGYPMSGTLKIEDIWNLEYPGNAVSIRQPVIFPPQV